MFAQHLVSGVTREVMYNVKGNGLFTPPHCIKSLSLSLWEHGGTFNSLGFVLHATHQTIICKNFVCLCILFLTAWQHLCTLELCGKSGRNATRSNSTVAYFVRVVVPVCVHLLKCPQSQRCHCTYFYLTITWLLNNSSHTCTLVWRRLEQAKTWFCFSSTYKETMAQR